MKTLSKKDRENLIEILKSGKEIPAKYRDILIGEEDAPKEYELTYAGKMREEDIIADTLAAPLQEVRTFNSENKFADGWTNKLIFGDNLMVLKSLYEDPNIRGKVRLIYIDPPFATKQDFMKDKEKAYKDKIIGSKFLEFIRRRLILLKGVLHENGSIYVHLDQKKGQYIKVIMDEIFEENNYRNQIIWKKNSLGAKGSASSYPKNQDIIYFYSKSESFYFSKPTYFQKFQIGYVENKKGKIEEKLPSNIKIDKNKNYYFTAPKGDYTDESIQELDKKGLIEWSEKGNARIKTILKRQDNFLLRERYVEDVWDDIEMIFRSSDISFEYPTQKPEALLERIISASSREGDIVLDAFAGSGTTLAVAEKLKRRWIGIDCGKLAIYTMQKRMLNLHEEIGSRGRIIKPKAFTLYNAGLYDWTEVRNLDFGHYRDFVLKLFQVREEKHAVRGIEIDGYIGNDNAYLWNHAKEKKAKLDLSFVKSLHSALSGKGGDVFYIIAPTNAFTFYEDEIKHDDTTYKTLRVPQSVIAELIRRGGDTLKQPTNEQNVNDTIDSVGFDFIQTPEIETVYEIGKPKNTDLFKSNKECVIKIKTFRSRTLTKSPEEFRNHETLSMVMTDYDYDGKVFDLDEVFYADKLKPDFEVRFDSGKLDKQMMVIYLDIYGNEKKEILSLKDFKK